MLYAAHGGPPARNQSKTGLTPTSLDDREIADVCASFQRAAVGAVTLKLNRAFDAYPDRRTLLVGGGVSANSRLRAELLALGAQRGANVVLAPLSLCVDNAAMIAGLGARVLAARGWSAPSEPVIASPAGSDA